jgi:hypothetical protein
MMRTVRQRLAASQVMSTVLPVVAIVLAVRTAYLCFRYFSGDPATQRFHVETSTLWFVLVALTLSIIRTTAESRGPLESRRRSVAEGALWVFAAAALYWPALTVGLLSDDFPLADRAYRFALGSFNAYAFRPLPLAEWGLILHAGGGPVALHALNVVLHGLNAFLASRLIAPLAASRGAGVVAGSIVLTMPILVEPVVWCSGVFDVQATTFMLLAVLASRRYERDGTGTRIGFFCCSIAALLSKETALVLPLLVLLDTWMRQSRVRRLYHDVWIMLVAMALIGALRLPLASDMVKRPLSKYLLQRWVFGTVGGFAVPWHADIIAAHPWLPTLVAWIVIALLLRFSMNLIDHSSRRVFYGMASWVLIGTAPALTFFFIGRDLQSSRYLYLPAIGWAGVLVAMIDRARLVRVADVVSVALALTLVPIGVFGVRKHLAPWQEAGLTRNAFERAAAQDPRLLACPSIDIRNAPDSVRGAYVLRNGAVDSLKRDIGFRGESGPPTTGCSLLWNPQTGTFSSAQ